MNVYSKIEGTGFYKDTDSNYWKPVYDEKQTGLMQTQFQKMTKLEFLTSLAEKYPSDIKGHGYIEPLSKHLPDTCRSMLEIGIAQGYSAQIWTEFYGVDNTDLHYLDLFENPDFVSARWCRNRGIVPHVGSQASMATLTAIKDQFDVILDDGSHAAAHMLISFKHLFINNLKAGGVYIITDTHCNKDKFYWGEGVVEYEDTPLAMFNDYLETGKIKNYLFSEGEAEVFQNLIKVVHIEADEKMIVIYKR